MQDSFHDASAKFHEWLVSRGALISPKISIADLRKSHQGRGVIATQDIKMDEELFSIPRSMLLEIGNCALIHDHPDIKSMLQASSSWEALIIALLYEVHVKREESNWFPYLSVLPIGDNKAFQLNQLLYWSDEELKHLEPSLILERVGKDTIASEFDKLCSMISKEPALKVLSNITISDYQGIASLIMSYSFDVPKIDSLGNKHEIDSTTRNEGDDSAASSDEELIDEDSEMQELFKAMVPLADTLNADTKLNNAQLFHGDDSLVMRSIKQIKKGAQVYNTYADHPNSEILRRYGFVEHRGSKHDFAEIPARIIKDHFVNISGMSSELYDELMHILSLVLDVGRVTDGAVEEIVLDSYDCFVTSEVIMEFVFIVQILTIVSAIHRLDPIDHLNLEAKTLLIDRIYHKCFQLMESIKLTAGFKENYSEILNKRMLEYPAIAKESFKDTADFSRKAAADVVLKCEYQSLQNCLKLDKVLKADNMGYTFIDDGKLIRNIRKRKSSGTSQQETKKPKAV